MVKKVSGTFIMDGSAINIECGFIPDKVKVVYNLEEGDNEVIHEWWRALEDIATNGRYGISISATGAVTVPTTAATGITTYDTVADKILIVSPNGEGFTEADPPNPYTVARSTAATARSTTALGTVLKPSSGNETGYVYECTTAGTGSAEPTWPTVPGQTVTDGTTVFTTRESRVKKVGVKGFTIGATMSTDSDVGVFEAEQHDRTGDFGDAVIRDPIVFPT
jgi:hypothetical protein